MPIWSTRSQLAKTLEAGKDHLRASVTRRRRNRTQQPRGKGANARLDEAEEVRTGEHRDLANGVL
jgi:hypothetical protein